MIRARMVVLDRRRRAGSARRSRIDREIEIAQLIGIGRRVSSCELISASGSMTIEPVSTLAEPATAARR